MLTTRSQAISLFTNNTKYTKEDIKELKLIHKGFTNTSYYLLANDNKGFQVRLGDNLSIKERINENSVLKLVREPNYIYYDYRSGNAIKRWISGKNPTKQEASSLRFITALIKGIHKIQSINTNGSNIIKHHYTEHLNKAKELPEHHKRLYIKLIGKYSRLPLVLSHNDLNVDNVIYDKGNVVFIDYEYSRLNNKYWDIANFMRETNIKDEMIINYIANAFNTSNQTLREMIYVCVNYAYQWTYSAAQTKKILFYRNRILKQLNYWFSKVN